MCSVQGLNPTSQCVPTPPEAVELQKLKPVTTLLDVILIIASVQDGSFPGIGIGIILFIITINQQ